jgi:hypothetical protein
VPRLSVWMIRTALVYLVAGFALGAGMLVQRAAPLAPTLVIALRPLHVELLTLGWVINLGLGVGYWILPRHASAPERGGWSVVLAAAMLNAGVLAVGLGQSLGAPPALSLLGRLAEAFAALIFARHAWRRVKPFGARRIAAEPANMRLRPESDTRSD